MAYREIELVLESGDLTGMISAHMKTGSQVRAVYLPEIKLNEVPTPSLMLPNQNGIAISISKTSKISAAMTVSTHILSSLKHQLPKLREDFPKENWNCSLIYLLDGFNQTQTFYLAQRVYNLIDAAKTARFVHPAVFQTVSITPVEMAELDIEVTSIKLLSQILNCDLFTKSNSTKNPSVSHSLPIAYETGIFYAKKPKGDAEAIAEIPIHLGHKKNRKTVVKAGSRISEYVTNFKGRQTVLDRRAEEEQRGRLKNRIVLQDIPFTSQSAAACFVLGDSSNGNDEWETQERIPLKQLL